MHHARQFSAGILLLLGTTAAFAHAHPKAMSPPPDSAGPAPKTITITFSEAIEPKFSSIQLTDVSGKTVDKELSKPVAGDSRTLTLAVPMPLSPGSYIVHWLSVAVDGHRMEGVYKFTVK